MRFSFFPALFQRPPKMRFDEQEANEIIELFLRQHPITNVPWILTALFISLIPPVLFFLDQFLGTNFLFEVPNQVLIGGLVIWYLLVLAYVIEQFIHWYFNIYIVTNIHLVDIDFYSLFARTVIEVEIKDVQSQSSSITGFFASFFNYGDVIVRTANEKDPIVFENIPRPDFVADVIQDLQKQ